MTNLSLKTILFLGSIKSDSLCCLALYHKPLCYFKNICSLILVTLGKNVEHSKTFKEGRGEERALRTQLFFALPSELKSSLTHDVPAAHKIIEFIKKNNWIYNRPLAVKSLYEIELGNYKHEKLISPLNEARCEERDEFHR